MSTLKGLAVATALAGMMFSGAALAQDDGSTTSVTEEGSVENMPDGSTVTTSTVTSITETPAPTRKFGRQGDWVLGIERIGGVNYTKATPEDDNGNALLTDNPYEVGVTLFVTGPKNEVNGGLTMARWAFDIFVIDSLSIGFGPIFGYQADKIPATPVTPIIETKQLAFGAQLRAGYSFNLSDTVSIWPRAGLEFVYNTEKLQVGEDNFNVEETKFTALWFMADAPVVITVTEGFGISIAPTIDVPLLGDVSMTECDPVSGACAPEEKSKLKILNLAAYVGVLGFW